MKTWATEPCDPEASLRFHGDVPSREARSWLSGGRLALSRRQLWRSENYITHISAVIAYSNGNTLDSMGQNKEADMQDLTAPAWTGPSMA